MPYLLKYNDLFLADFFVFTLGASWTTKPADAMHLDEDTAVQTAINLCKKKRKTRTDIILVPEDFEIVWIDSPIQLWNWKPIRALGQNEQLQEDLPEDPE